MTKKIQLLLSLLLALTAGSSYAYYYNNGYAGYGYPANYWTAPQNHFFVGGELGFGGAMGPSSSTYFNYSCPRYTGPFGCYNDYGTQTTAALTYRGDFGYLFTLSPWVQIGPEIAYFGYSDTTYNYGIYDNYYYSQTGSAGITYSGNAIEYLLLGKFYYRPRFAILGQMGVASVSQTLATTYNDYTDGHSRSTSSTATQVLPDIGIGAAYDFLPNITFDFMINAILGNSSPSSINFIQDGQNTTVGSLFGFNFGVQFNF